MKWAVAVQVLCVYFCSVTQQNSCDVCELAFVGDDLVKTRPTLVTLNVLQQNIYFLEQGGAVV